MIETKPLAEYRCRHIHRPLLGIMIRFLFRFVGLVLLAAGFIFFVYDGAKTLADNVIRITKVGDVWNQVHSTSLQLLQPAIERHVAEWLWDPVVLSVLTAPTWLVLAIVGSLLMIIGRKKKPLIGYARD